MTCWSVGFLIRVLMFGLSGSLWRKRLSEPDPDILGWRRKTAENLSSWGPAATQQPPIPPQVGPVWSTFTAPQSSATWTVRGMHAGVIPGASTTERTCPGTHLAALTPTMNTTPQFFLMLEKMCNQGTQQVPKEWGCCWSHRADDFTVNFFHLSRRSSTQNYTRV